MKKNVLAVALVSALAAGSANALTITQTGEYGLGYSFATTNWLFTLTGLSQFDTLGGTRTLNSVALTLDAEMNQQIKGENTGANPDTLTPLASGSVAFRQGVSAILTAALSATGAPVGVTAFDGISDFGGTSGVTFPVLNDSDTVSTTLLSGGFFSGFIGTGDLSGYNIQAKALGAGIDSTNGNLDQSVSTDARGRITIVYNYDERQIPEPTSMLLIGFGLLGLGASRRRKA